MKKIIKKKKKMRPVVTQGHKVWLSTRQVVGSIPTRGNEIFSFLPSGVGAKRGVEFHHSTHVASKIRRKLCLNTMFPLSLLYAGYSVKLKKGKSHDLLTVMYCHFNLIQWLIRLPSMVRIFFKRLFSNVNCHSSWLANSVPLLG